MSEESFEHKSGLALVVVALESELPGDLPKNYVKLITGVGKINATLNLTRALLSGSYDTVINYGSAGGFVEVGQLVAIEKVIQRDMDCSSLGHPLYVTPFENYLYIQCQTPLGYYNLGHICASGDSFCDPDEKHEIIDMEAYALARVCKEFHIPFHCYKYISDSGSADDWRNNHNKGASLFRKHVFGETV